MGSPTAWTKSGPFFVGKWASEVGKINSVEVGHSSAIYITPSTTSAASSINPSIYLSVSTSAVTKETLAATTTVC